MTRLLAPLGALVLLAGCQDGERTPVSAPEDTAPAQGVVARYDGGTITVDDVDAHILALPAADRPAPGSDLEAWYSALLRGIVVERLLLERVRDGDLRDDDELRRRRVAVHRQLAVQSCLLQSRPEAGEISREAIDAAYEARKASFQIPERRSTYHLYLRKDAGERLDALEERMRGIRDRILRGESFQRLASRESESESRHRQGGLGWIQRGDLPEHFEQAIFGLPEGVPSEPIVTRDGVHLFMVEAVLAERQLSPEEAEPVLIEQLQAEQVSEALDEMAARNQTPSVRIVDRETLEQYVAGDSEDETVLFAEDHEVSLREFRQRLGRVLGEGSGSRPGGEGRITNDSAWDYLTRLRRHEAAFEYCRDQGLVAEEAVARQAEAWVERAGIEQMRQQLLHDRAMADESRLELYYQSNIGQFTPPVKWRIARLRIPFDEAEAGMATMAALEEAAADNGVGLDSLQKEFGGELEELGWLTQQQLRMVNVKLPSRVAAVNGEALIAPLRVNDVLEIYRVNGRQDPEPRPLQAVIDRVASAYLRQYTSEIYKGLEADLLERANFELYPERLEALRNVGFPSPDVTVDELDALLSGS